MRRIDTACSLGCACALPPASNALEETRRPRKYEAEVSGATVQALTLDEQYRVVRCYPTIGNETGLMIETLAFSYIFDMLNSQEDAADGSEPIVFSIRMHVNPCLPYTEVG